MDIWESLTLHYYRYSEDEEKALLEIQTSKIKNLWYISPENQHYRNHIARIGALTEAAKKKLVKLRCGLCGGNTQKTDVDTWHFDGRGGLINTPVSHKHRVTPSDTVKESA